ncbi:MAG: hypothetical protein O2800_03210 [Planctomycetota bacterium]|nr:hypothetical protein [Planctomycetota bacterium]
MKVCHSVLTVGAVLCAGPNAFAGLGGQSFTGTGGLIADASAAEGITVFSLVVPESFGVVSSIDFVSLQSFVHTYAGDIKVQLRHGGVTVDLVNRVGLAGSSIYGDSSDYNGTYSFSNQYFGNLWASAASVGSSVAIASGNYYPSTAGGIPSNLDDAFDGLEGAGLWEIVFTDYSSGDQGFLASWSVQIVPAPGALALLLCGGSMLGMKSRNRGKQ